MASLDLKDMLVKGILNLIDQDRVASSDKNSVSLTSEAAPDEPPALKALPEPSI